MGTVAAYLEQIEEVCCDMSPAFFRGIQDYFPQAEITFDAFHIMKLVNKAINEVRIREKKKAPDLKHTKYLWLKNESSLKDDKKERLMDLVKTIKKHEESILRRFHS
ncbi:ISL3 family transposase [Brevibacillus reuszeri]|uniref:ISL3 family transposase n=1 Tax=Brevibacillus reuszeri TaxID=54915 RepID=UPI003D22984E